MVRFSKAEVVQVAKVEIVALEGGAFAVAAVALLIVGIPLFAGTETFGVVPLHRVIREAGEVGRVG